MGWDVTLRVWFESDQAPKDRFINLAVHLGKNVFFAGLFRVVIRSSGSPKGQVSEFYNPNQILSIDEVRSVLEPYPGEAVGFEGWWQIKSHYFNESNTYIDGRLHHDPSRKLVEELWRIIITVPGKDYYFPGYERIGMTCEIGAERHFSPRISKAPAQLNILSLLHELSVLVELGVSTIHGSNIDNDLDPRTFYLSYHSDPNGFCKDLTLWTQHLTYERSFTKEDIIDAVICCSNTEYLETKDGIFVFCQDLVDGNLGDFYTEILRLLGTS